MSLYVVEAEHAVFEVDFVNKRIRRTDFSPARGWRSYRSLRRSHQRYFIEWEDHTQTVTSRVLQEYEKAVS